MEFAWGQLFLQVGKLLIPSETQNTEIWVFVVWHVFSGLERSVQVSEYTLGSDVVVLDGARMIIHQVAVGPSA